MERYLAPCKLGKASPYKLNYRIKSAQGKRLALLQIHPKAPKISFVRLDFNPKAIGIDGMNELTSLLAMLFGPNYQTLLGNGKITRLDASVDIEGQHIGDLIAYTTNPQESTYWMRTFPKSGGESWIQGSLYMGAKNSGRRFVLYDKACQRFEVRGEMPKQAITRIEVRYLAHKCSRSAIVADVLSVENPLSMLALASYRCDPSIESMLEFFLLGVREWGFNPALSKVRDKNKRTALRKAIGAGRMDWWQPDRIWKEVLEHLASLKLFPSSVFKCLDL